MSFWISDDTYVKKINGKLHLVRTRRPSPSKNASKEAAENTNRSVQPEQLNSSAQRVSADDNDEDSSESKASNTFSIKPDKLADFFAGSSSLKTLQEKQDMANDDTKEAAPDTASNKSTSTENIINSNFPATGSVPPAGSVLPPGFQVQPGIYQYGGRTLALLPKPPMSNNGYVGGGYPPQGFGQQPFMYGGGPGPMNSMMMQPQMGMSMESAAFGGFNSQYDRVQPVEVTNITPATSITVTRHVCANCGTLRSRKFQAENPLEPGEVPPISYCRKCEKEIRSTDDESDVNIEVSRGKKLHRASYMKMPEPQVVVQPVIIKGKHRKHKKEKELEKQGVKAVVAKGEAAFLHTCAQCGRARSRKYQARHPIRKGETPAPSFCGKCQKEETSSEDSGKSDEAGSNVSHERRTRDSRQFVSLSMIDERVATRRQKQVRVPPPIRVVEEYSSSSESVEMPPPPQHFPPKKTKSSSKKKKYESTGEDLMIEHRHRGNREQTEERGRGRGRAESQSHHHRREKRSIYEIPSPLMQETMVTERVPARRARSLDRGERPQMSRARSASRHVSKPASPKRSYNDRGDYESYESDGDTEDIAREMYKAYLSDGAPMHEEHRHYHHQEKVKHRGGETMSHSESFDSNRFSEASKNRRRERSTSGHPPPSSFPPATHEPQLPDPVLQRPPDEVIVTTERYVFKRPDLPNSSRIASSHTESTLRDERHERGSATSSRKSQKYLTHEDKSEYYPEEWSNRYGRREPVSRPKVVVMEEMRRNHRKHREYDQDADDSSITPVPGSFLDADESTRSVDSYYEARVINPSRMLRNKANTESISTDRSSETWTTSSGSRSSKNTTNSRGDRYAPVRGVPAPRGYHTAQVPGEFPTDSELTTSSVRGRLDRGKDRDRGRRGERRDSPPRRRRSRSRSSYHQPSVSDVSGDSNDSDHATAGVGRSRSTSRERGRKYRTYNGSDLTANDRIRSVSRNRKVSFGGKDKFHTYSQVSLDTGLGKTTTDEVLREIERARELERRREEKRREDERREKRRRERAGERDEMKRRSEKERDRDRQVDHEYGYASGRG